MWIKLVLCRVALLGALSLITACGSEIGPPDAEVKSFLSRAISRLHDGLLVFDYKNLRREVVDNGDLHIHLEGNYKINKNAYEQALEYVRMSNVAPLAFSNPIDNIDKSIKTEISIRRAKAADGKPFSKIMIYRHYPDSSWRFVEMINGGA